MAVYLKSLGQGTPPAAEVTSIPTPESSLLLHFGQTVYEARCAICHASDGSGMPPAYPPLAGNPSIQMQSAVNPIRMVLNGGFPPGTQGNPRPYGMPPFAQSLSDDEVAAVVTYIRAAWGNRGSPGIRALTQINCVLHLRIDAVDAELGTRSKRPAARGRVVERIAAVRRQRSGRTGRYRDVRSSWRSGLPSTCWCSCRARGPMSDDALPDDAENAGERTRASLGRRRHRIIVLLVAMAVFAGVHQAVLPQSHVETADPRTLHLTASSSRATSAARCSRRLRRRPRGRPAILVHAAMHPGADGHADHLPRHQRRRGAWLPDHRDRHQSHAGAGLHLQHSGALLHPGRTAHAMSRILRLWA